MDKANYRKKCAKYYHNQIYFKLIQRLLGIQRVCHSLIDKIANLKWLTAYNPLYIIKRPGRHT